MITKAIDRTELPPLLFWRRRLGRGGWLLAIAFVFCLCLVPAAFGFSSDGSSLERKLDRWTVSTNSPVVFTVTFTNAGPDSLRGFYFADQIPSSLAVNTLSVSLDGLNITNYAFESGQTDDAYPGCIPYRWILEQPVDFIENNAIPSGGFVQITYSVVSPVPGTFALNEYNWAGYDSTSTNASFGYSETADQQALTFLAAPPSALLSLNFQTNTLTLQLTSVPGCSYIVQESTNLSNWTPLATNISPFSLVQPNAGPKGPRFYRALWLP